MRVNYSQFRKRLQTSGMMALLLLALGNVPAWAQGQPSQTPDLQKMQKKLDLLEQEISELKAEMSAMTKPAGEPAPAFIAGPSAVVKTQTVETEPAEKPATGSSVDFYGFVMLDSGYQFGANDPNWFDVMRPSKLPAYAGEFGPNGNTYWGVRQTRFGVKTFTPTKFGNLKTIFEFELFGAGADAGQTTFRLRQAYGELGHFGAGQTWSPFMDIDVFPNSLEYWGPNGMVFFRNVQVRWMPLQGDNSITVALERPGATADQGVYSGTIELQNIAPQFKYPNLTGNTRFTRKWGYIQIGGIVEKIAWVDTVPVPYNLSGTAIGWGVSVSSNLYFTKKDTGKFQIIYGEGVENYMNDAPVDIGIKNTFSNTVSPIKGVPLPVLGIVSFLDHTWSDRFTSSVGFSMVNITNSDAQAADAFHQGYYALGNVLYHPLKRVTLGGEFQFGRRVNYLDGFNVNDYRVQFSAKFDWNKGFEF